MMLTQVTLKISFPDHLCQGMLPEISHISAQLPHRDESKGIWTALTGECIAEDSIEQPVAGLWGLSLNPGILWQAARTPTVSAENAALSVPSTWARETVSQGPQTPSL